MREDQLRDLTLVALSFLVVAAYLAILFYVDTP